MKNHSEVDKAITPLLWQALTEGVDRVKRVVETENFQILVNDSVFETKLLDAVLVSPAIHNQLISDPTLTTFCIKDSSVTTKCVSEIFELFFGKGKFMEVDISERKSMIRLCQHFKNHELEKYLLSSWTAIFESSSDVASSFYCFSAAELSLFSVECLSEIVSSENLVVSDEDSLLKIIVELGEEYCSLLDYVRYEYLSEEGIFKFVDFIDLNEVNENIWRSLKCRLKGLVDSDLKKRRHKFNCDKSCEVKSKTISSTIIDSIPTIFGDLCSKGFELLYRGSRDGFRSEDFHSRCDNKGGTVTIVETTTGFIFGGYTPLSWNSSGNWRQDDSLKSFLFSLKNSMNTEPKRFPLKSGNKQHAIYCGPGSGPAFGGAHDLYLIANSNTNSLSASGLHSYDKSGYDGTSLAGEYNFMVKEIEVFLVKE
jgi:hypothetical protein